jgi:hypothetical protein
MGRTSSAYVREEKCIWFWLENVGVRNCLQDLSIGGSVLFSKSCPATGLNRPMGDPVG